MLLVHTEKAEGKKSFIKKKRPLLSNMFMIFQS